MAKLSYTPIALIPTLDSVEVSYTYDDLPQVVCQMVVAVPYGKDKPLNQAEFDKAILAQALPREWFESEARRLAGRSPAMLALPASLQAVAPIGPLPRPLEWYEDCTAGAPVLGDTGWVRPQQIFSVEDVPQLLSMFKRTVADYRYRHEVGGVSYKGHTLDTSREGRQALLQAANEGKAVVWKTPEGDLAMSVAETLEAANTVANHVEECFAKERKLNELAASMKTAADLYMLDIEKGWAE